MRQSNFIRLLRYLPMAKITERPTANQDEYTRGYIDSSAQVLRQLTRVTDKLALTIVQEIGEVEHIARLITFLLDDDIQDLLATGDCHDTLCALIGGVSQGKIPWCLQLLLFYVKGMEQERDPTLNGPAIPRALYWQWEQTLSEVYQLRQGKCNPPIPPVDGTGEDPVAVLLECLLTSFFVNLSVMSDILTRCDQMAVATIERSDEYDATQVDLARNLQGLVKRLRVDEREQIMC